MMLTRGLSGRSHRRLRRTEAKPTCRPDSGEWTGTIDLTMTRPSARLRPRPLRSHCRATVGDGTYRIFGQKIFIHLRRKHDAAETASSISSWRGCAERAGGSRAFRSSVAPISSRSTPTARPASRNDVYCVSIRAPAGASMVARRRCSPSEQQRRHRHPGRRRTAAWNTCSS